MTPIIIGNVVYRFLPGRKHAQDIVLERLYVGLSPWERVRYDTLAFELSHLYNNEDILYPNGRGGEMLRDFLKEHRIDAQRAVQDYLRRYR